MPQFPGLTVSQTDDLIDYEQHELAGNDSSLGPMINPDTGNLACEVCAQWFIHSDAKWYSPMPQPKRFSYACNRDVGALATAKRIER